MHSRVAQALCETGCADGDESTDPAAIAGTSSVTYTPARSTGSLTDRKVAQAQAETQLQEFQASKEAAKSEHEIDTQKVLLVIVGIAVVASAGYGVYKGQTPTSAYRCDNLRSSAKQ